jgi:hypothetical protein
LKADSGLEIGEAGLGQQQDRRADPSSTEYRGLLHKCDCEPISTSAEHGLADRYGPVTVAIGLDDGTDECGGNRGS